MKRFRVRMKIKRTSISYEGFGQLTDCEHTNIMSEDYRAADVDECINSLKQIFGDEIVSGYVVETDTKKVTRIRMD